VDIPAPTPTASVEAGRPVVNEPAPVPPSGGDRAADGKGGAAPAAPVAQVPPPAPGPLTNIGLLAPLIAAGALGATGALAAARRRFRRSSDEPHVPREQRLAPRVDEAAGFETTEQPGEISGAVDRALPIRIAQHFLLRANEGIADDAAATLLLAQGGGPSGSVTLKVDAMLSEGERLRVVAESLAELLGGSAGVHQAPDKDFDIRFIGCGRPAALGDGQRPRQPLSLLPVGVLPGDEKLMLNWPTVGHTLVAGDGLSGAEDVLVVMVAALARKHNRAEMRILTLASPGSLPAPLARLPQQVGKGFVDPGDTAATEHALEELRREYHDRREEARRAGGAIGIARPDILVVMGELAEYGHHANLLMALGSHGSKVGIRLLAATTRVGEVSDGMLAYFPTRLVLHVSDHSQSIRLLGSLEAAELEGAGRMLVRVVGRWPIRARAFRVNDRFLENLVEEVEREHAASTLIEPVVDLSAAGRQPQREVEVPKPAALPSPEEMAAAYAAPPDPSPDGGTAAPEPAPPPPEEDPPTATVALPDPPPATVDVAHGSEIELEHRRVHVAVFGKGMVSVRNERGEYEVVSIPPKSLELVGYLSLQPGMSATKAQLRKVFGIATENALDKRISRARTALVDTLTACNILVEDPLPVVRQVVSLDPQLFSTDAPWLVRLVLEAEADDLPHARRIQLLEAAIRLYTGTVFEGRRWEWLDDHADGMSLRDGFERAYERACVLLSDALIESGLYERAREVLMRRLEEEPTLGDLERRAYECCFRLNQPHTLHKVHRDLYELRKAMLADEEEASWSADPETLAAYERYSQLLEARASLRASKV
nr:hypothetical protein [Actinomycetota bacterium]